MGCGGSKSTLEPDKNNNSKTTDEPELEHVDVPSTEPGYPPLRPPRDKKADIVHLPKLKHIDQHAKDTPAEKGDTYDSLIAHLMSVCKTDLEKLRAIFVWLGNQDTDTGDYSKVTNSDTPRGFLKLIQKQNGRHSSFFALLCRRAGIPCVIVKGHGKAVGYEVGDMEDKVRDTQSNTWNLVFVAGGWRIVFPLWAFSGIEGHVSGIYTKVEVKGKAVREKEDASAGKSVRHLDEFYFLTDPDVFVFFACASDVRQQLLVKPWSLQKFCDVPYCRDTYFKEKAAITSKFSCRLHTVDGVCNIELTCADPSGMTMDYELYYNHEESGRDISPTLQLNNFVFLNRTDTTWNFGIRFPEQGVYKLVIQGGHGYEIELCSFKIYCDDAQEDCKPLPLNPGKVGFGPNLDTELAGLSATSHRNGLVKVTARKQNEFKFTLTKTINIRTTLIHQTIAEEELQQYVKSVKTKGGMNVTVSVPEQGEYALCLHTQQEGQAEFKNVCNYLLTSEDTAKKKKKKRDYENALEKSTRSLLQLSSKTKSIKDIEDLERAIDRFERLDMDDKGDLEKAYNVLEYKKVKKELDDATKRRHLETLEKAISHGKESKFREKLQPEIKGAEDVRDHLQQLKRIAHDVLEMKQTTISELHSYKSPPTIVFKVMRATLLVLGEKPSDIEDWEDLTGLIRKLTPLSFLRRVRQFDTINVQPETLYYVNNVLDEVDETEVCLASAGAGTFYRWLTNVSKAIDEQNKNSR